MSAKKVAAQVRAANAMLITTYLIPQAANNKITIYEHKTRLCSYFQVEDIKIGAIDGTPYESPDEGQHEIQR